MALLLVGTLALIFATGGARGSHHVRGFVRPATEITPAQAAAAKLPRCHTAGLRAHLVPGAPGARRRSATIELQNTRKRACTVRGYPQAQLVKGAVRVITRVRRDRSVKVRTVRLAKGDKASAEWRWTPAPTDVEPGSGACRPTPTGVRITPPGERRSLRVKWKLGPVCDAGRISSQPFRAAPTAHVGH
jgi:hypothetical protein